MKTVNLDPQSLAHHLRVAAKTYTSNAEAVEEEARSICDPPSPGWLRVSAQFTQQAKECIEWAEALENFEDPIDLSYQP